MNVSVIIPVYNSSSSLGELVPRLQAVLASLGGDYELILVNDGSQDKSWDDISQLSGEHSWIKGIDLMRNYGQHGALLCGIRAAKYETIVTMDDDLQHPPEEIPKLLTKLSEAGVDVVYGAPEDKQHDLWRNLGSKVTWWTVRSSSRSGVRYEASAFRAFRTKARLALDRYNSHFVCIDVLLTWATTRIYSVKVRHDSRRYGASTYTFRKLVSHALVMLTGFSILPLRFASLAGFGFTLFGFLLLVYVLGRYFWLGGSLPGFPFLASAISIFSGAQLFALGVIGEYVACVHLRSMGRPVYTVRCTTGSTDQHS